MYKRQVQQLRDVHGPDRVLELLPGLFRLPIPLPRNPLRELNACLLYTSAAICARFDTGENAGGATFPDLVGHWAKQEVERAVSLGWIIDVYKRQYRGSKCFFFEKGSCGVWCQPCCPL